MVKLFLHGGAFLRCSVWLALGALAAGCGAEAAARSDTPTESSSVPSVLATIGEEQITMEDVRSRIGDQLDQMDAQYQLARHQAIQGTLDELLRDRLIRAEARKQGRSPEELLAAELGQPIAPTDAEVSAWFMANQDRIGGRSLEQVRSQIANHLTEERRGAAIEKLEERLKRENAVKVNLKTFRVSFNNEGAPTLGPMNAPVTLVEFSDFECPFCKGFAPTIHRLQKEFGDQLRIVYRQFPLTNIHPNAFKAAEASLCAHEQAKFWEMHDLNFEEQDRMTVRDLKNRANRIGLDQDKFNECLEAGRYVEQVQEDMREGTRVGVNGTPALFVNGVPLEGGALPYEAVAAAIRREASRTGQ